MAANLRNVEIKAKVEDVRKVIEKAKELSQGEPVILNQKDTFYFSPKSNIRLKLREEVIVNNFLVQTICRIIALTLRLHSYWMRACVSKVVAHMCANLRLTGCHHIRRRLAQVNVINQCSH